MLLFCLDEVAEMSQTLHPPIRLHTRFIKTLKIIQYAGYLIVGLFGVLSIGFSLYSGTVGFIQLVALVQIAIALGIIYIATQGMIAIIDLLSRIEQNTRSSSME
jgi:hypothetical protein